MNITAYPLKKGINLYLIKDKKFKTYMASVLFHRAVKREEAAANALLSQVLRRGNELYPTAKELNIALEELYGASLYISTGKRGEEQILRVTLESVSDEFLPEPVFGKALRLLFAAAFKGSARDCVEQEKNNLIDIIRGQINDKRHYANLRLNEIMFENEPYGINSLGSEEAVIALNADSLFDYYKTVIDTSAISIILTGNFDEAAALESVRAIASPLAEREGGHFPAIIKGDVGSVKRVTDRMDVTQGKLSIGFRTGIAPTDELSYAQTVFSVIYGGSPNSKLFLNVREKLSLCYYASAWADRMKGFLRVSSGIEFQNFDAAYNEIMAQLEDMRSGSFSDEDIDTAKKELVNAYRSRLDSVESIEDFYTAQLLLGTDITIDEAVQKIEAVTRKEIVEVANKVVLDTVYFLAGKEEA